MLQVGLVDEAWYLAHHPDVADAVRAGHFRSGEHHYVLHGILEGRLPRQPEVDAAWYLATYPDVAAAVRDGRLPARMSITSARVGGKGAGRRRRLSAGQRRRPN